ncbi:hypothetical protein DFH09DRAFT_1362470 [Mycena vulgaris]|nr:hypothetical protein DFH09DRAFT_1362470 [Mycena vulgaris]
MPPLLPDVVQGMPELLPPVVPNPLSEFDSDDEEENSPNSEDIEPPNPSPQSTNIKADFEAALKDFDFDGEFAVCTRYAMGIAPNPCLEIDGLGTIGLPLSERDARAIIAACDPAYASAQDSAASAIQEMSPEKIHFDNPAWDIWLQKTAGAAASKALTASATASTFALRKLLIHTTGITNHTGPTVGNSTDGKIGDLIAVLPARHEGGQLQVQHAGQSKSFAFASQSGQLTSIVAAYSGVKHTMTAITTGARLALVYDIFQPPTTTRAALPELRAADRSLHDILLSWKHDESDETPMLACLLRHKYSEIPDFCAESLQGRDAALVSHLRPIARKLKFRMLLAQIDYTVSTEMQADDDDDDEDGYRRYGDYYGNNDNDDEEIDEYCFEAVGVPHESLYFGPTVNLDGIPVEVELDLKPGDLLNGGNVTNDVADERTFERDDRTEATRTEVYKRTILLLWPKNGPLDSTVALGDTYDYACNALHKSTTTAVTRREKLLVDSLLGSCETPHPKRPQRAVQVLAKSARRWDDIHLLLRTLKACGVDKNTGLLGVEGFVSCSKTFGWDALKDFCNDAMTNEESNIRRDALLARLTQMSVGQPDPSLSLWCQNHEETSLRSLRKVTTAQLPALVERALARGGVFLRNIILPQLQTQKLSAIGWMLFVANFHKRLPPNPPSGDAAVFREVTTQCITNIVSNLPAFPQKTTKERHGTTHSMDVETILHILKLCIATENVSYCAEIFTKMRDAARRGAFVRAFPPWMYYTDLCRTLVPYLQSAPAARQHCEPFFLDALESMLSPTCITAEGVNIAACDLASAIPTLMLAARHGGGIPALKERHGLTKDVLTGRDLKALELLARAVVKEFPRQRIYYPTSLQARTDVLKTLVRATIDTFKTSLLAKSSAPVPYWINDVVAPQQHMLSLVKFCFEVEAPNQCEYLLPRFATPPDSITWRQHASDALAPFLPRLREYLHEQGLDLYTEPYRSFITCVLNAFTQQVMTAKPPEAVPVSQIESVGCQTCAECRELRSFLLSPEPILVLRTSKRVRTHLEHKLARTGAWGVLCEYVNPGYRSALKITKPESMVKMAAWSADSVLGKTLLDGLGDVTAQRRVLGEEYDGVHARIIGAPILPAADQPMEL